MLNDSAAPVLAIKQSALEALAALLLERAGLKITPDGYYGLRLALSARMPALGIADADEYVQRLKQIAGEHELRSLLPLVTVGHTEFFRDARQFNALQGRILPALVQRARREGRKAMLWSAGCATGEEPYSLAMAAAELGASPEWVDIWATDLNQAAVATARLGRFSPRRLAGVSGARLKRFFRFAEDSYEVVPLLREYIRFEGLNLAAPVFPHVPRGGLDLILCRNVIIYFDLSTIRALMGRFFEALQPGGVLLLGYSESLFKVYDAFEMFEVEGTFAYRRPGDAEVVPGARIVKMRTGATERKSGSLATPSGSGVERPRARPAEVRAAPARPASLAPPVPEAHAAMLKEDSPGDRLSVAVEKMHHGDFEGALATVEKLCADHPTDLNATLTLGNLHSLMGQNARARAAFEAALALEPLCVEARIFSGLAALQVGALEEARSELSKALFLEPGLAVGHYLLAEVLERQGVQDAARRSYRNALAQLRFPQRQLAGHYPELPESAEAIARAARYALALLSEV
ncbi:MAG: CheR family methyltransferase [Myxococcota bacterium]